MQRRMTIWNKNAAKALSNYRAFGQILLRHAGQATVVIVARVAEMRGAETEKHGDRTTKLAFIFEEICTMFQTFLQFAPTANTLSAKQLLGIERVVAARHQTGFQTAKVGFLAFEAGIVCIIVEREDGARILGCTCQGFLAIISQPHQAFFPDIVK